MKCGLRVALGVAGGYFLGRTKKMKLAFALGGMAAGRRAGGPAELLSQATKLLDRSPELQRLTDEVRGRLLDAGKGAAMAVAARQVEALTDRVGKPVESLGDVGAPGRKGRKRRDDEDREPADEAEGDVDEEAARADEDERDEDEDTAAGETAGERAPGRGRAAASATAPASVARSAASKAGGRRAAAKPSAGGSSGAGTTTRARRSAPSRRGEGDD